MARARDEIARKRFVRKERRHRRERHPQFRHAGERRFPQTRTGDADDGHRQLAESDRASDDGRVGGEERRPQIVAKHNDGCPSWQIVVALQAAAENDRDFEHREVVGCDRTSARRSRRRAVRQRATDGACAREVDGGRLLLQKGELRCGSTDEASVRAVVGEHELLRVRRFPRLEQERVHRREEHRIDADAEHQRQQRRHRESRAVIQASRAIADVLPHALEPRRQPDGACLLTREGDIAELPRRLLPDIL